MVGVWHIELRDAITGKLKKSWDMKNLLPTIGREAWAVQMAGEATKDVGDNLYVAVGTSTSAPAAGDTTLGTETFRKAASSSVSSGIQTRVTGFYTAGDDSGTYKEAGIFGDGKSTTASAAADSGILYSHVAINITKTASETLTLTWYISFKT